MRHSISVSFGDFGFLTLASTRRGDNVKVVATSSTPPTLQHVDLYLRMRIVTSTPFFYSFFFFNSKTHTCIQLQ